MQDLGSIIAQLDGSRAGHYWLDPGETRRTLQALVSELEAIIGDIKVGLQTTTERQSLIEQAHGLSFRVKVAERLHQQSLLLRQARYKELAERVGVVCGSEYGPGSAMGARFDAHRLVAEG